MVVRNMSLLIIYRKANLITSLASSNSKGIRLILSPPISLLKLRLKSSSGRRRSAYSQTFQTTKKAQRLSLDRGNAQPAPE